jgi:hypothetical protein
MCATATLSSKWMMIYSAKGSSTLFGVLQLVSFIEDQFKALPCPTRMFSTITSAPSMFSSIILKNLLPKLHEKKPVSLGEILCSIYFGEAVITL